MNYFSTLSYDITKISSNNSKKIHFNLFDYFFESKMAEQDWDFLIRLCYIDFFSDQLIDRINCFLNTLVNTENATGTKFSDLLMILTEFEPKVKITNFNFLHGFLEELDDEDDLKSLLKFIDKNNIDDEYILDKATGGIANILHDMAKNNDLDIDYQKHISHNYYEDGYMDTDIDLEGVQSDVYDIFNTYLTEFSESALTKIGFDLNNVVSNVVVEDLTQRYLESQGDEYEGEYGGYTNSSQSEDDIDAIFER